MSMALIGSLISLIIEFTGGEICNGEFRESRMCWVSRCVGCG